MSTISSQKIQELTEEGYAISIGQFLNSGFQLFRKSPGLFIAYTILSFLIAVFSQLIPFLGTMASILISYPLLVGFYLAGHELLRGRPLELSTFFRGFEYFGHLAAVYFIQFLAAMVIMLPLFIAVGFGAFMMVDLGLDAVNPAILWPVSAVLMIPLIYITACWTYAPLFVVFYKMSFWEAMETSRKIIHKRWWMFFGFLLVVGLILMAGVLALFFGILVAYPVAMLAIYVSFAEITELHAEKPEADILDHLVE